MKKILTIQYFLTSKLSLGGGNKNKLSETNRLKILDLFTI